MKTTLTELKLESNGVWVRDKTVTLQTNNENIRCVLDTLIIPALKEYGYDDDVIYRAMNDIGEETSESF